MKKVKSVTYPEGHLILRNLAATLPVAASGKGIWIKDAGGKKYLDASGGAFVTSIGHGRRDVAQFMAKAMSNIAYVNGTQFTNPHAEALASALAAKAQALGLDRVGFLSSGSEVVEAAAKFARQLCVERGETERTKFIVRSPGYHGNTLFALSLSQRAHYKKVYGPLLFPQVLTVSAPTRGSCPVADYEREGARFYARELEALVQKNNPSTICAFVFEPVSGSSTGVALPPPGYFEAVTQICTKYKILMIADEVLCGTGRTGRFFASEHFGLKPDILVLGKGISGGYVPLSALLVKKSDLDLLKEKSGGFVHAQTFMHVPSIAAAGLKTLEIIEKEKLVQNSAKLGEELLAGLEKNLSGHPHVGAISGLGLLAGIEFVKEKSPRAPFSRSLKIIEKFQTHCHKKGLIIWPNYGHINGTDGDLFCLAPPLNIKKTELQLLVRRVSQCVKSFKFPKGA